MLCLNKSWKKFWRQQELIMTRNYAHKTKTPLKLSTPNVKLITKYFAVHTKDSLISTRRIIKSSIGHALITSTRIVCYSSMDVKWLTCGRAALGIAEWVRWRAGCKVCLRSPCSLPSNHRKSTRRACTASKHWAEACWTDTSCLMIWLLPIPNAPHHGVGALTTTRKCGPCLSKRSCLRDLVITTLGQNIFEVLTTYFGNCVTMTTIKVASTYLNLSTLLLIQTGNCYKNTLVKMRFVLKLLEITGKGITRSSWKKRVWLVHMVRVWSKQEQFNRATGNSFAHATRGVVLNGTAIIVTLQSCGKMIKMLVSVYYPVKTWCLRTTESFGCRERICGNRLSLTYNSIWFLSRLNKRDKNLSHSSGPWQTQCRVTKMRARQSQCRCLPKKTYNIVVQVQFSCRMPKLFKLVGLINQKELLLNCKNLMNQDKSA